VPHPKESELALKSVKEAMEFCHEVQRQWSHDDARQKEDRSPVTLADLGSQALMILALQKEFPDDPVVAEEDAAVLREDGELFGRLLDLLGKHLHRPSPERILDAIDSGAKARNTAPRFWTMDPLDGTKGFLRGDQYAVALALVEKGEVAMGVLGCPNFPFGRKGDCIVHAARGMGTTLLLPDGSREKVRVDGIRDPRQARFCESWEKGHSSHEMHARIASKLGIVLPPYRMDSQAKYAALACADVSLYLRLPRSADYREKIWDHAAGSIIVREAGGKVTDFRGAPLNFTRGVHLKDNTGVLATNGHLHEAVLRAIAEVV